MRPFLLATALALLLPGLGHAAEYTIKGSVACTDVLAEDSDPTYREMNKWWLMGYVTARNFEAQQNFGRDVADEELYQMGLAFCRSNRDLDWDDAAQDVYGRLAL